MPASDMSDFAGFLLDAGKLDHTSSASIIFGLYFESRSLPIMECLTEIVDASCAELYNQANPGKHEKS